MDINTPLAKWSEAAGEFRPNIIIGYPSAVKILAELIDREKKPLYIGRVISCGEPLSAGLRKYLENVFHAEVINFYGASESLALGVEQRADKLVLHEAKTDTDCFFTRADMLLCRSEDVMWFEKSDGSRECLHPLSMEGFCVEGLLDYQFCQTSGTSFEMLAEIGESAEQVTVTG